MPTENKLPLKQQRVEHVNQVIRIIAGHGHRFFYSQAISSACRGGSMKPTYLSGPMTELTHTHLR